MKHEDNWRELMNAVVYQACSDYKTAMKKLKLDSKNKEALYTKRECEAFLKGELCEALLDYPKDKLISQLKEDAEMELYYESAAPISPKLLKQAREKAGLTREEMAYKLGYNASSPYTAFESGRPIPPNKISFLLKILGVEYTEISSDGSVDKASFVDTERLREARLKAGKTMSDVSIAMGFSPSYYRNIEAGVSKLPARHLKRCAEALETTVEFITGEMI